MHTDGKRFCDPTIAYPAYREYQSDNYWRMAGLAALLRIDASQGLLSIAIPIRGLCYSAIRQRSDPRAWQSAETWPAPPIPVSGPLESALKGERPGRLSRLHR